MTYKTEGTCSQLIEIELKDGVIDSVKFTGGCNGNLQGVARLCEGKNIDEIENLLSGVLCRNGTSCPDQLSKAIAAYKKSVK